MPYLTQLLIALRFYFSGNYHNVVGDATSVHQSSVSSDRQCHRSLIQEGTEGNYHHKQFFITKLVFLVFLVTDIAAIISTLVI